MLSQPQAILAQGWLKVGSSRIDCRVAPQLFADFYIVAPRAPWSSWHPCWQLPCDGWRRQPEARCPQPRSSPQIVARHSRTRFSLVQLAELGGRASCQGNGSALVSGSRGGKSGERGGVKPGVASSGAVGAIAPESSAWTSPRGEAKGVVALSVSDSVIAASVSEPVPCSSPSRGDESVGSSCICAKACNARSRRRAVGPSSGGPG